MATRRLQQEDIAGIAVAVAAHVALVGWLIWAPKPAPPPLPERVSVTLEGPIADQASALVHDSAAPATAPQIAPEPAPVPLPVPQAKPVPVPVKQMVPPPRVGSDFLKGVKPPPAQQQQQRGGASRIGNDFLKGALDGNGRGHETAPAGPVISAQVKSSLVSEVSRQLKPHWQQPDGVDVDKLATTLEWDLNPDGSLNGPPRFVRQDGVNAANRAQADRHREQAIRAVRLSAPFRLPPQFYAGWQRLRFTFDWKLN